MYIKKNKINNYVEEEKRLEMIIIQIGVNTMNTLLALCINSPLEIYPWYQTKEVWIVGPFEIFIQEHI